MNRIQWMIWKKWLETVIFSSPELKAQVTFLIACCSSSLWPSIQLSVNCSHFHLFPQNQLVNFKQTKHKNPWMKGIQDCTDEVISPFTKGDKNKKTEIYWQNLKNLLLQKHRANSNKLHTMYSYAKGIKF